MNNSFWNKYNNLLFLKILIETKLNQIWDYIVKVPSFFWLDISYFDLYLKDKSIFDKKLLEFFDNYFLIEVSKFNWEYIILRSSALYSEDSEEHFWAWLYKSLKVKKDICFKEFKNTVIEIYESLNFEKSIKYRSEKNIKEEKMGIVIQEFIPVHWFQDNSFIWRNNKYQGFLNSSWINQKNTIVISQNLSSLILDKQKIKELNLEKSLYSSHNNEKNLFYWILKTPFDIYKIWFHLPYIELGLLSTKITDIYWKENQIEYIINEKWEIVLLQIRPFPKEWLIQKEIIFPKDKELIESYPCSFILEETELDVWFVMHEVNKNRILFQNSSHSKSLISEEDELDFMENLPKILVLDYFQYADHWHLESIAAEKWWIVISWTKWKLELIKKEKKVIAVSNWIEIRFYKSNNSILTISNKRILNFFNYYLSWCFDWNKEKEFKIEEEKYFQYFLPSIFQQEFKNYNLKQENCFYYLFDFFQRNKDNNFLIYFDEKTEKYLIKLNKNKWKTM